MGTCVHSHCAALCSAIFVRYHGAPWQHPTNEHACVHRPVRLPQTFCTHFTCNFPFATLQRSTDELTAEARARATALVEAYVPTEASAGDLRSIEERQLRHKAGTLVTVSPPCRYGFPQAFAFDPCGHKVSSGLFRLSCPKLVQAIDELEDEGGIEEVNARLEQDEDLREVQYLLCMRCRGVKRFIFCAGAFRGGYSSFSSHALWLYFLVLLRAFGRGEYS